jgi:hypothetical protein
MSATSTILFPDGSPQAWESSSPDAGSSSGGGIVEPLGGDDDLSNDADSDTSD